jgi:hypothetical protein
MNKEERGAVPVFYPSTPLRYAQGERLKFTALNLVAEVHATWLEQRKFVVCR